MASSKARGERNRRRTLETRAERQLSFPANIDIATSPHFLLSGRSNWLSNEAAGETNRRRTLWGTLRIPSSRERSWKPFSPSC